MIYQLIKCLTIFIFFLGEVVIAQDTILIDPPTVFYDGQKVNIKYNISNSGFDFYNVDIQVIDQNRNTINSKSITGDIGLGIKKGKNKTAYWDLNQDEIFIDQDISIRVIATPSRKLLKSKLILQSAIFPGWGQSRIYNKPFWLIGCATVGFGTGAYIYNQRAVKTYNKYINATDNDQNLFNQTKELQNLANTLTYSAISLWTINLIWTAVVPPEMRNYKNNFSVNIHSTNLSGDKQILFGYNLNF